MGIFEDLGSDAKKIFLAGLGAMSTAADKGQAVVDKLVSKGEITVEEGRQLNSALAHRVQEGAENLRGGVLLKYMRSMTIEQRKEFVKKVVEISDQLDKEESDFSCDRSKAPDEGDKKGECTAKSDEPKEAEGKSADSPESADVPPESDPAGK
ncbi:MAG: phasin family protein [Aeriscardovia sp.]|nr:phasin family protein [Aeriscardovia sp.]MBQ5493326.1 phasin family protein [Aeriscardovia sp.]